ncbi:MAG: cytochrome b [Flavobacteriales bacterium]
MKTTNDLNQKYSTATIAIHWVSTILILILFPLGKYTSGIEGEDKLSLIQTHALLGLAVLILTLIRTWLFFKSKRPADLKTNSKINDKLIIWVHNLFYILLFAITISGIAAMLSGGYVEALESQNIQYIKAEQDIKALGGHELLALIMVILVLAHEAVVIKHYIKNKENTLKRILP